MLSNIEKAMRGIRYVNRPRPGYIDNGGETGDNPVSERNCPWKKK
jgi:hypothetical protein